MAVQVQEQPAVGGQLQDVSADSMSLLRDMVREAVISAEVADPREAVDEVLKQLVREKRTDLIVQAAREGLLELAWSYLRHDAVRSPNHRSKEPKAGKWDVVGEDVSKHRDIFQARVWTGATVKFLGDCSKTDLANAAEMKRKQGTTLLDNADRLDKLAKKLKRDQVVQDLDRAAVEEVFSA